MMKIAVTDYGFSDLEIERTIAEQAGFRITAGQCKTTRELIELTADADAVITQFAPVNGPVIAAMNKAKVIVRYGIGVDNVDLAGARLRNIPVCNVPDYCTNEVAEHALSMMLALTRQLWPNVMRVREGGWGLGSPLERMRTLGAMVTGLVGFGRIGREVAQRVRAFGGRVLVSDPFTPASAITAAGCEPAGLDQILSTSDIISLHCPCTPDTDGMINTTSLEKMKPGVLLINVGRGRLIETDALVDALRSGHVSGAGLDVTEPEPLPEDHPLRKMHEVLLTSHIAAMSPAAIRKLRESAAQLAVRAIQGQSLPNIVNGVVFGSATRST
jgi:D-3-phosphoglycerate dehydrogenase / 2-oxoglutarate reductase